MRSTRKGTAILLRFLVKRDRVRIPVFVLALVLITCMTAMALSNLYSTSESRQIMAETMVNPAMTAMLGKGYGLDNYTIGAMMAHQMLLFTAIAMTIMNILLVARHTRADEEEGRIELIRSLPTGRLANLYATLTLAGFTNLFIGILTGLGLFSLGIESINLEGSLLYGTAIGVTGFFFATITAIFAQLSENARGTIGFSFTVLGVSYLLRAIGDIGNEAMSMASPLGWILSSEVLVTNKWWPIIITFIVSLLIMITACVLYSRRDLGAGLLPTRPGKRTASASLLSPFGLSLRLQRTGLISWAIGMFLLGASYGSVLGDLDSFFVENDMFQQLLNPENGHSLTEQFLTMIMSILAMISSIPALMSVNKLIAEEKKGRIDHLLSKKVSRNRLLGSAFLLSIITSLIMVSLTAIGLWTAGNMSMENGLDLWNVYSAALVYLPAVWLVIGLVILVIGIFPRASIVGWIYLMYSFIVVYLGNLLEFPKWLSGISPYGHIPELLIEEMRYLPVSILFLLVILFVITGFIGYNKRDIQA
ncbi:ABC transporter permease [Oceanobacillus jordanicus]|uniref:ABC transporter permease n=1 Tax=Oceanobacillus jordanicus TaxID=2867266 RepID=A0AAW5B3T6_9BACI|nr:ABC transporter permease [Oceanobacillus jordanicus]MCG3419170.1 ABC transporter permease [Oceanobacillus jordanicus]